MVEAEDGGRSGVGRILLAPVRFLLHWFVKVIVLVFLGIGFILRPRIVRYGLAALVLVVAGNFLFGWNLIPGTQTTAAPVQASAQAPAQANAAALSASVSSPASQVPKSPVVERYLLAQANFDAKAMWDSISDDLKASMQDSNMSLDDLQQELDNAKQQGNKFMGAQYVGGVNITGNRTAYFYVLTVNTPQGSNDVPYIYVVGKDGKIVSIQ